MAFEVDYTIYVCDVLVTSEGEVRVKLYRHSLTKTLSKLKHHHLVLAKSCWQVVSRSQTVVSRSQTAFFLLYWDGKKGLVHLTINSI